MAPWPGIWWGSHRQPYGNEVSIRHACHQHHSLPDHWLLAHLPCQASGTQSRLEILDTSWLYRCIQHLLDLRMGDPFDDSHRRILGSRPVRGQQFYPGADCSLGRLRSCGDHQMRTQRQLALYQSILEALPEPGCPFCRFLKRLPGGPASKAFGSGTPPFVQLSYVGVGRCAERADCRRGLHGSGGESRSGA